MGRRFERFVRVVAVAALVGCGSKPRDPEPVTSEPVLAATPAAAQELVVEHAGCTVSTRTPATCTLRGSERALRLWVDALEQPTVEIDGALAGEPAVRVGSELEGWRTTIAVPSGSHELIVRAGAASWRLELRDAPAMPVLDALEKKLPNETDPGRSKALVPIVAELAAAIDRAEGLERVLLLRLAGIICWDLGRRADAISYSWLAIDSAIDARAANIAIGIAQNLEHFVSDQPAEVGWLLELQRLYIPETADASLRARWHYALAYQAFDDGELGDALTEATACAELARKIGAYETEMAATSMEVSLLAVLGREAELHRATSRILALTRDRAGSNSCHDAVALAGTAWSLIQASTSRGVDDQPARILERALAYYEPGGGCAIEDNPDWALSQQFARVYHALDAVTHRDYAALRTRMAGLDASSVAPELRSWVGYLAAESAFAAGRPGDTLAALRGVDASVVDSTISWRATVLRGRALEALDRRDDALAAYLESEAFLDRVVDQVAIDQGIEGLGAGMHAGAARAIAMLLEDGDSERALSVARRSRARALRPAGKTAALLELSLEARQAYQREFARYRELSRSIASDLTEMWRIPADERARMQRRHATMREQMRAALARAYALESDDESPAERIGRPAPGAMWLVYHPSEDGWFGFAVTSDAIVARSLGPAPSLADDAAVSRWLLEPFAAVLADPGELHVLAMGALLELRFESLPRPEGTLLSERAVAYALDSGRAAATPTGSRALVVGDPADHGGTGRLLRAREEATEVASELERGGYQVELLLGEAATHAAVVQALARADWFHHAGHGRANGSSGWDVVLQLAGEANLTVGDVLALPRSPRGVVLTACDTGVIDPRTASGGMNLAAAFVLAGSQFVIAAGRKVDDDVASRFSHELYKRSLELRKLSGPELLRATALALTEPDGEVDAPFRVWVP